MVEFTPSKYQKVNKHPKFDNNCDIQCQLEHFEYDMNRTLETFTTAGPALSTEIDGGVCVGMEFYF